MRCPVSDSLALACFKDYFEIKDARLRLKYKNFNLYGDFHLHVEQPIAVFFILLSL